MKRSNFQTAIPSSSPRSICSMAPRQDRPGVVAAGSVELGLGG